MSPARRWTRKLQRAAMARVLDLADVLELVVDGLDDRPLAQEQLVGHGQQAVAHVLAQLGDEVQTLARQELLGQRLGDVAPVAEELAEEAPDQAGNGAAVVDVARREAEGEQLAAVVDHQVQLEAVEPADRGLAAARIDAKDAMLADARGYGRRRARSSR